MTAPTLPSQSSAAVPGESARLTGSQWIVLIAAFLGWMFDGVEIGLFPQVARPALQELLRAVGDAEVGRWNGYIVACFLLGAAFGGVLFGWLGDKIGRVRSMALSILAYSIFTGAGYFATEAWHLGVFRFLAALGMGGQWAVAVALVVECWPERYRPHLAGMIGAAANVGFLLIGCIAYYVPVTDTSWRWIMLVGAAPAVLALLVLGFVPESERWKESVKKAGGKPPLLEIFGPKLWKRTVFGIVFSSIPLIGTWAAVSGWIPPWVEQMHEAQLVAAATAETGVVAKLPVGAESEDAAQSQVRQTKTLEASLPKERVKEIKSEAARSKARVQILCAIGAILGAFVAPLLGGLLGRRPVYFLLCILSLITCTWLFRGFDQVGLGFYLLVAVVGTVTAAFYGWLPLYLPELFPTRVRATAQGLSFNFGRIFAAAGAVSMGELVNSLGGNYAAAGATIALIYIAGMFLIWLAPETKGKPLPE